MECHERARESRPAKLFSSGKQMKMTTTGSGGGRVWGNSRMNLRRYVALYLHRNILRCQVCGVLLCRLSLSDWWNDLWVSRTRLGRLLSAPSLFGGWPFPHIHRGSVWGLCVQSARGNWGLAHPLMWCLLERHPRHDGTKEHISRQPAVLPMDLKQWKEKKAPRPGKRSLWRLERHEPAAIVSARGCRQAMSGGAAEKVLARQCGPEYGQPPLQSYGIRQRPRCPP